MIYKQSPFGSATLDHDRIKGDLVVNGNVSAYIMDSNEKYANATVTSIKDLSVYVVGKIYKCYVIHFNSVFNDGDEKTLRRTQICLKGAKHFDETLDTMPLTNPEMFSSPVGGYSSAHHASGKHTPDSKSETKADKKKYDEHIFYYNYH